MSFAAERSRSISTLVATWDALVRGSRGAVESGAGFVAARCDHPVFNNALLLAPETDAVSSVRRVYEEASQPWSLWTSDAATAEVASQCGFVADGGTTDMTRTLADLPAMRDVAEIAVSTPALVADINGLPGRLVARVEGFDAFTASDGAAGLMTFLHGHDVHLSFLATRPEARRRGLAGALVIAALHDARRRGAKTATLQATPAAVTLYEQLGFQITGEWREWRLR